MYKARYCNRTKLEIWQMQRLHYDYNHKKLNVSSFSDRQKVMKNNLTRTT